MTPGASSSARRRGARDRRLEDRLDSPSSADEDAVDWFTGRGGSGSARSTPNPGSNWDRWSPAQSRSGSGSPGNSRSGSRAGSPALNGSRGSSTQAQYGSSRNSTPNSGRGGPSIKINGASGGTAAAGGSSWRPSTPSQLSRDTLIEGRRRDAAEGSGGDKRRWKPFRKADDSPAPTPPPQNRRQGGTPSLIDRLRLDPSERPSAPRYRGGYS